MTALRAITNNSSSEAGQQDDPRWEIEDVLVELAQLQPLQYDKVRHLRAEALGVRVDTLDQEVKKRRAQSGGGGRSGDEQGRQLVFEDPAPWPQPVSASELLDQIQDRIERHVVLSPEQSIAVTLWALATWFIDVFDHATRLAVVSAEKQSGKTTLCDVLERIVRRGIASGGLGASAVARLVELSQATLLIDEADTFMHDQEGLIGVLNQGHRRGGQVIRCVGDKHEVRAFSVFGFCVLACIGALPGTLEDRSIPIEMRRARKEEKPARIGKADKAAMDMIRSKCQRFVQDNLPKLVDVDPELPDCLSNRQADNWRPLIAIAELAGPVWRQDAVDAALKLSGQRENERTSDGIRLLSDIRQLFAAKSDVDRIHSANLCAELAHLEGRQWSEYSKGKALTQTALAAMLEKYGIEPKQLRIGPESKKGYYLAAFADAFSRYLPQE
jgi:putative DNA primase/helicase